MITISTVRGQSSSEVPQRKAKKLVVTVQIHPYSTKAPQLTRLEDADLAASSRLWTSIWELVAFLSPTVQEAVDAGTDPLAHTWDPYTAGVVALEISSSRQELTDLGWWETTLDCFAPLGDRDGRSHMERATYALVHLFSQNKAITVRPLSSLPTGSRAT